jgi:DNA-binding transcriptional MerR regulator
MTGSFDSSLVVPLINRTEVFRRLRLTAGKAAELCGITRRQLCYWTDKGIIPCVSGGNTADISRRIYDLNGLCKALALKRLMDEGRGLRRAVRELKAHWSEPPAAEEEDPGLYDEHSLLTQAERLSRLGDKARQLGALRERREMLVRLALALQPLALLAARACEARVVATDATKTTEIKSLLGEVERAVGQLG